MVFADSKPLLAIAGPGTGKTKTVIDRAEELLRRDPNTRILLVTYTRDAAEELTTRIKARLPKEKAARVLAGTFHSLAMRRLYGKGKRPAIIGDGTLRGLLTNAISACGWPHGIRAAEELYERFSTAWLISLTPEETALVDYLESLLKKTGSTTFSGIVRDCIRGFEDGSLKTIPVDHMIVDEAQDLDDLLYHFAAAHWKAGVVVSFVADDDQSIYKFKHSLGASALTRFSEDTNAQLVRLQQNFRCAPEILTPAVRLIGHNKNRFDKNIFTNNSAGGLIDPRMYKLPEQELSDIVRGVKAQPDKWALLARHNREIDHVELAFIKAKIPYIRPRKDSVWSSRTADVLIALLESLFTDDPAPLLSRTLASLCLLTADECPEGGTPRDIFDAIRVALEKDLFAPRVYGALNRLPQVWTGWKRDLHHFEPQYIITSVANWASAIIDVKEHKLLESLRDALIRRKGSLKSRIERQLNGLENNNGVALSTMHGSKGREFQCVWIYALNKRIDIRLEDIEEERRLNYVAFTRAKRTLMISCSLPEGPADAFAEAGLTPRTPHLFLKSRTVRSPGQSGPQPPGNNPDNNSKPKRKRRSLLD